MNNMKSDVTRIKALFSFLLIVGCFLIRHALNRQPPTEIVLHARCGRRGSEPPFALHAMLMYDQRLSCENVCASGTA
jgi:hypothetical protein